MLRPNRRFASRRSPPASALFNTPPHHSAYHNSTPLSSEPAVQLTDELSAFPSALVRHSTSRSPCQPTRDHRSSRPVQSSSGRPCQPFVTSCNPTACTKPLTPSSQAPTPSSPGKKRSRCAAGTRVSPEAPLTDTLRAGRPPCRLPQDAPGRTLHGHALSRSATSPDGS